MAIQCLAGDGNVYDIAWRYINSGWVPAITVCTDRLYTIPVDTGDAVTMEIVDLVVSEDSTSVTPTFNRTICRFPETIATDITFTADASNCAVGDELILIFSIDRDHGRLMIPVDTFFLEWAGEDDHYSFVPNNDQCVLVFTFDGDKFISTHDHC